MRKVERIQRILELLWRRREISTSEIRDTFGLSEATVRRDVSYIVQTREGISRYHGGLRLDDADGDCEQLFDVKLHIGTDAKQIIAGRAARMVNNGDRLFLDSGSTCLFMARELVHKNVTVVTTDIKIAHELGGHSNVETYIVGGLVRPGYYSVGTSLALSFLRQFSIETVYMSCDAVDLGVGITNAAVFEVEVKRQLIESCERAVLMADSTKFDRREMHSVAPVSMIDVIVTDPSTPAATIEQYRKAGPKLIVA